VPRFRKSSAIPLSRSRPHSPVIGSTFIPSGVESFAFSVLLRSLRCFVVNVSGQHTGLVFRDKDAIDMLTLEDDSYTWSRKGSKRKVRPGNNPE
jgi:hypothetical protein